MKFIRRSDLTVDVRINMALEGLANFGTYGYITQMAETYKVSRTFIYYLLYRTVGALYAQLNSSLYPNSKTAVIKNMVDKEILLHRLEGNSSIERIANILEYHNIRPDSVGYISRCLASYGSKLSNTIEIKSSKEVIKIPWLNDEVFAKGQPVILTVKPNSLAIVRIELAKKRDAQTWKNHFSQLLQYDFYPQTLSSDRGKGIIKASEDMFPNVDIQPDTFHDIRQLTNAVDGHLQKKAYNAIAREYKTKDALLSAKSTSVEAERLLSYNEAKQQACKAIELYDDASFLKGEICEQLEFIDKKGDFRNPESAMQNILTAVDLLNSLGDIKVLEAAYTLKTYLEELLLYMSEARKTYEELSDKIRNQELLQTLCMAWRYDHKIYQNPTATQKKHLTKMRDFTLQYSQVLAGQKYNDFKEQVFSYLDNIVRGSSLVEAVNSLIRPYINTCKGQITQQMLNLIMFYHNHRKFNHGKRKGKAPIEILTGEKLQSHWLDVLVEKTGNSA